MPGKASGCRFAVDVAADEGGRALEAPFVEGAAEAAGREAEAAPAWLIGCERLVDKFNISLPCTTMVSFDFLRSRVSISAAEGQQVFWMCSGKEQ